MNSPTEMPGEPEPLSNRSVLALVALLVQEDGIMRPTQIRDEWLDHGLVEGYRYWYCTKKGYEVINDLLIYAGNLVPRDPREN